MSQSKPPTPMPKPVTPSVAQPGQAAPGVRPGSAPSQQGQRIAAHGQTIYVQQHRGVDPRWIAIASVTATLIALLFVAVVLWNYRNQPAQQQAPLIINVNSGQHGTTTVSPQSAVDAASPVSTPASSTSTASPSPAASASSTPTATPASATPSATVAAVAPPTAAPQPTTTPVAVTPPTKPTPAPGSGPGSTPGNAPAAAAPATAVKRESPVASAAASSSAGSVTRSAIPAAGENVTKPVAPTRLGPAETPTATAAAEAPAAVEAPRGAASKTSGIVVPWNEAHQHMGKNITIEGTVVSTRNIGSVCFLNFDKNWQGKFYIAIVEPSAMTAWPKPPQEHFLNQKIRVTGQVSLYQDRPQMRITKAESITIAPE